MEKKRDLTGGCFEAVHEKTFDNANRNIYIEAA